MLTREILARLDASKTELRGILESHQGNALPDEVGARADAIEAEIGRLDVAMRRAAVIEDMDRRAVGRPLDGSAGSPGRMEVRAFEGGPTVVPEGFDGALFRSQHGDMIPGLEARHKLMDFLPQSVRESRAAELGWGGFMKALHNGPNNDLERRVMGEAAIGTGGALVPTVLSAEVIDLLRPKSVAFQAGARMVPMTTQILKYASILADPIGSWRQENSAITVADPTFGNITLTAKSWALIVKVSRELLEDATNLDDQLRSTFARVAALALDAAILYGSGTSNQPLGLANTPGIQTINMGTNGTNFATYGGQNGAWAAVLDAALALDNANAGVLSAMIMAPRTARAIGGFNDASGNPMTVPARLANVPMLVTTSMGVAETQGTSSAASSILLGDFSEVYVGMRTALQVSVLNERYSDMGQVGFCLWMRADVAVARPAALARIQGIVP